MQVTSKVYSLDEPYKVNEVEKVISVPKDWVVVEPILGSICHADLRYFTGSRKKEALAKKLPMALIHEGIGKVIESRSDKFQNGERVLIVPNIPGRLLSSESSSQDDKYSEDGVFMASGYDGIAQSKVVHPSENLVLIPEDVSNELAVLGEMQSVSVSAIMEHRDLFEDQEKRIAIIGDGPVGFFAAAFLKSYFSLEEDRLTVFGADDDKLEQFNFTTTANSLTDELSVYDRCFDIVIEATGGNFSEQAIDQSINMLDYRGHLMLMGVTEEKVAINTRDILEKGLTLYGSSRSVTEDFKIFIELLQSSESYREILHRILPEKVEKVKSTNDFEKIMIHAAENPHWKKIIMEFCWN